MQIDISKIHCEFMSISAELTMQGAPYDVRHLYRHFLRLLSLGAKQNSKVGYLAYHAKTQRARIKNLKRLYKIGCSVEKRGYYNAQ